MVYRTVICVLFVVALTAACGDAAPAITPSDTLAASSETAPSPLPTIPPTSPAVSPQQADFGPSVDTPKADTPLTNEGPATTHHEDEHEDIASEEHGQTEVWARRSPISYGPLSMEEHILRADVVIRARLSSVATSTRYYNLTPTIRRYIPAAELTFDVLEVLNGTAESSAVVELQTPSEEPYYATETEAAEAASQWKSTRATQWPWSGNDAILFLWTVENSKMDTLGGRPSTVEYVFLGDDLDGRVLSYNDTVTVLGGHNKVWLPATTSSEGGSTFYLEDPSKTSAQTQTLTSIKSSITATNALIDASITGHKECLIASKKADRASIALPLELYAQHERTITSGLPANTGLQTRTFSAGATGYSTFNVSGDDVDLFHWQIVDSDSDASTGYKSELRINRPLPKGSYVYKQQIIRPSLLPCNHTSDFYITWTNTVEAPEGVAHELFFDPVMVGSAIKADATNGVLRPTSFTDANAASASIGSISYESGTVKIEVTPNDALAGHIVDFIELDGTLPLSLDVANATVDAANDTLSWSVSAQPWEDGDLLMVRIREAR